MLANTRQSYGLVAQCLHWLTAVLIFILLALGIFMHELPIATPAEVDSKIWFYSLHKTLGILAFATAVTRIIWVVFQTRPFALNSDRKFESLLAGTIHWLLYGCIILMPITGWLHHAALEGFAPIWWSFSQSLPFVPKDPELAKFFSTAHNLTSVLLMASLGLHIAGAFKHALIDRDQTLARMTPWRRVDFTEDLKEAPNKKLSVILASSVFALLALGVFLNQLSLNQVTVNQPEGVAQENTTPSSSGRWIVDPGKSSLNIEIIQGGGLVTGSFANWQADIFFDPDDLGKASVIVNVDIASLTLGSVTKDALSKDFLNAAGFPQAIFSAKKFTKLSDGKYQAGGELILAGKTKPLTLPFELRIENNRAFMSSAIEIERLDYDIGRKGFVTDGTLGFGVKIKVELEAERK